MKNVCVVLKKKISAREGGESAVLDAFYLCGYSFEEIRILPQADDRKLCAALTALKADCDNVLLLADKTALPIIKGYLAAIFEDGSQNSEFGTAGIYTNKQCSLFLLSADESETGDRKSVV